MRLGPWLVGFVCSVTLLVTISDARRQCTYFGKRRPKPVAHLPNCSWYQGSPCCKQQEAARIFDTMPALPHHASPACMQEFMFLACYFCSPDQADWFDPHIGTMTVCEAHCDRIYT